MLYLHIEVTKANERKKDKTEGKIWGEIFDFWAYFIIELRDSSPMKYVIFL